jgi:hypothetical protein
MLSIAEKYLTSWFLIRDAHDLLRRIVNAFQVIGSPPLFGHERISQIRH